MEELFVINRKDERGISSCVLSGRIDENADLDRAFSNVMPHLVLDLEGIKMINSWGVRKWILAMKEIPQGTEIEYEKCSPRIVEQVNYVSNFLRPGKMNSFLAPYYCLQCKKEMNITLIPEEFQKGPSLRAPQQNCPDCQSPLEFNDLEEEYFSFLGQPNND